MGAAPGWYGAPGESGVARYWDGRQWTENRRPMPPAPSGPPIPPVAASGYTGVTGHVYPEVAGLSPGAVAAFSDMVTGAASSGGRLRGIAGGIYAIGFAVFWLGVCLVLKPIIWDVSNAGDGEATIKGTVVSQNSHLSDEGSRMCSPQASFEVDGQTYFAASSGSSSICPSVGSRVTVIYRVADPQDARVAEPRAVQLMLLAFPLVGVLVLVLGIWELIKSLLPASATRWPRRRRDAEGVAPARPADLPRPQAWQPRDPA